MALFIQSAFKNIDVSKLSYRVEYAYMKFLTNLWHFTITNEPTGQLYDGYSDTNQIIQNIEKTKLVNIKNNSNFHVDKYNSDFLTPSSQPKLWFIQNIAESLSLHDKSLLEQLSRVPGNMIIHN